MVAHEEKKIPKSKLSFASTVNNSWKIFVRKFT